MDAVNELSGEIYIITVSSRFQSRCVVRFPFSFVSRIKNFTFFLLTVNLTLNVQIVHLGRQKPFLK